ncbi:hypothetical protein BDAP_002519 [Binucleata daphniae]
MISSLSNSNTTSAVPAMINSSLGNTTFNNITFNEFNNDFNNIIEAINDTGTFQIEDTTEQLPVDHTIPEYQIEWNKFIGESTKRNFTQNLFTNGNLNPDIVIDNDVKLIKLMSQVKDSDNRLGDFKHLKELEEYNNRLFLYYYIKKLKDNEHIQELIKNKQGPDAKAKEIAKCVDKHAHHKKCKQTHTYLNTTDGDDFCFDEYFDEDDTDCLNRFDSD